MTSDSNAADRAQPFAPHGFFLDGKSARQQPIRMFLRPDALRYQTSDGTGALWSFASIDWGLSRCADHQWRLTQGGESDSWLVITYPKAIQALTAAHQEWSRRQGRKMPEELKSALRSSAVLAAILLLLWFAWPLAADHLAAYMPSLVRDRLGDMAYQSMLNFGQVCHSGPGDAALAAVQTRISQGNPELQSIRVVIINSGVINAVTLPDNRVIITKGILTEAKSGDEIAGIMGHEFGHVSHDHVMRSVLRQGLVDLAMRMLGSSAMTSFPGVANTLIGDAYSRTYESEADQTSLDLLQAAKVSPEGFGDFFIRLDKKEGGRSLMRYLSDHPPPANRAAAIAAVHVPDATPVLTPEQMQALQAICDHKP